MTVCIPLRRISLIVQLLALGTSACAQSVRQPAQQRVVLYDVGARPRAIAVADLNRDTHPDIAVANSGDGTVTILFGDDSGRLGGTLSVAAGREPADIDAGDIDRDGDIDLLIANHETPGLTVLLNDGQGRFTPAPRSPFETGARPHIHGLATADFNGDEWLDVAVESADTREIRVLFGSADGLSAPQVIPIGTMPYSRLGVAHVTGDGRPDILVPGHGDSTLRAVESDGTRLRPVAWTIELTAQPWMVVGGDVNGDRRDDIVVVETDAVSIWLASARGFAQAPGSPFAIPGATEVAVGDLDGDGVAEVAVGPWDGEDVILLRVNAPRERIRMCERPIGLAIADLDGDGRGELLGTCTNTRQVAVTTPAISR